MNSVLSFNNIDFETMLRKRTEEEKENEKIHWHESTMVKQICYFILFFIINIG